MSRLFVLLCVLQQLITVTVSDVASIGVDNYNCPGLMGPSKAPPKSVHSVRPADIKVIAAMGDSLTAANGAGAAEGDVLAIALQFRGLAFQIGGEKALEEQVTIPNVLKKYNPTLFGYSRGTGSENVWEVSSLNTAVPGAKCWAMEDQAQTLVQRMKAHPESVDFENDWKLINIFIGGNDMCNVCRDSRLSGPNCTMDHIMPAIKYLHDNVPKAIVSLTTFLHIEIIRNIDTGEIFCSDVHTHECKCEYSNWTNTELGKACEAYQQAELELEKTGMFDDKDDFTLVVQPFMNEIMDAPKKDANGWMKFFAPDCFHFSKYGHAMVSTWLWKNILEPVGKKTTKGSFNEASLPLACPDPTCPFIRTTKNSVDCSKYHTAAADN